MNKTTAPDHVAIIMDRNGEWAKKRALARVMGHRAGVKAVTRIVEAAVNRGVKVLSLYAFSTENWLRPKDEVSFLMNLLEEYIKKEARRLTEGGVKLIVSGRLDRIPKSAANAVEEIVADTADNKGMVLNIALDYGGKDEISNAAKRLAQDVAAGFVDAETIDNKVFQRYLHHPELPDIDLLIRTGSVERISNFMLWQIAYAELYFTPIFWPDFSEKDFDAAIAEYATRTRRFGMTDEQLQG